MKQRELGQGGTVPRLRGHHLHRIHTSRSVMLRLSTAAMLGTLVVGGVSTVQMRKAITLDVDGDHIELVTLKQDVAEALADAGVAYGDRDRLDPAPGSRLADGATVTLRRARPVDLDVDGRIEQVWTTATTMRGFLAESDRVPAGSFVTPGADADLPLDGTRVAVVTPRLVKLADNGGELIPFSSPGATVGDFLARAGIVLGPQDVVEPAPQSAVTPETVVVISRVATVDEVERREVPAPERSVDDPQAPEGDRTVVAPGAPGTREVTLRVTRVNGQVTDRAEVASREVEPARERVVSTGTKPAPRAAAGAPSVAGGSVWDSIAQCESTGNWSINNGNGFSGGLQFTPSTWLGYGGGQYAPEAHLASREQQIAVAEKVQAGQGWGAWPACTSKLGLR